ncbi:unnamed protein product [Pylaiella littoralis]
MKVAAAVVIASSIFLAITLELERVGASTAPSVRMGASGRHKCATADAISFTVSNEYPALQQSAWVHVAEPFRATSFTASSTVGSPDEDVFQWSFEDNTVLEGKEVQKSFEVVGRHALSIRQIVISTGEVHHFSSSIMVKYVRREVRQLTEQDREAFFDALETLYRLPAAEGNARYGDDYKGIDYFVQMHLDGAGVPDCDHWHDDAGIMTHHVGYTLQFEQALQLVNPIVSIPYWEYTIESADGLASYGLSEVFLPEWFGSASPENPLHTVDAGRWAYLPVMKDAWEYVHNPYGLLRSPWNLDGTPYVTRHNLTNGDDQTRMVSCSMYQDCFDSTSLASLMNCLNGETHGPVHIKLGGEWNNPEEEITIEAGYAHEVPLITKYLWRKGYLRYPSSCSAEEDGLGDESTCRSSCPVEVYESRGMTAYDVLMDVVALHWISCDSNRLVVYDEATGRYVVAGHEEDEDFQAKFWHKVLHSLCDAGHVGELYTSSAPYDPLFWVIHPAADRFLAWRRKLANQHPDKWALDETWGYAHDTTTGQTGVVCDWADVAKDTLEMPTCIKGICEGHNADDMLPFKVKVKGEIVEMTNLEWYDFIYPDNEDLPYMYNEFSWGHCAAEGFYMGTPVE